MTYIEQYAEFLLAHYDEDDLLELRAHLREQREEINARWPQDGLETTRSKVPGFSLARWSDMHWVLFALDRVALWAAEESA